MKDKTVLSEILAEADEDIIAGRVAPIESTFNALRSRLKGQMCNKISTSALQNTDFLKLCQIGKPLLMNGTDMDIEKVKDDISTIAVKYPIKRILLFGSRADGTYREDSDYDLIVEFFDGVKVTLVTLSEIRLDLEDVLNKKVDLIHGPVLKTDMIEIGKTVELYVAQREDYWQTSQVKQVKRRVTNEI